jgi:hypothetical protein
MKVNEYIEPEPKGARLKRNYAKSLPDYEKAIDDLHDWLEQHEHRSSYFSWPKGRILR